MTTLSLILLLLLIATLGVAVYFYIQKRETNVRTHTQTQNLQGQIQTLQDTHQHEIDTLRQAHQAETNTLQQSHQSEMTNLQTHFQQAKAEQQRQWEERIATLKLEFSKLTQEHLSLQQQSLKTTNRESLDALLTPFRQDIERFQHLFGEKMNQRVEAEALIKQMMTDLGQQTSRLDKTTEGLTRALRGDSKKQGDWGEAVLNNILEASGLERGRDFFVQESSLTAEGQRFIPDVKVKLHGNSYLIIDAKTSIANYLDYVSAADTITQQQALRAHLQSVRQHVSELAEKHYPARVKDTAEYVLMFIPNEGSYLLAVDNDPHLISDAFAKGIIVVNPTLLMLALRIVWLFWQNEKQTKSVNAIILQAQKLYEKFVTFSKTYVDLGQRMQSLQTLYKQGESQLTSGPANIVKQVDNLRQKGIVSDKRIDTKLLEQSNTEPAAEISPNSIAHPDT